ncbi:endonuclease domain-containing protein [Streptomyces sp. NPDC005134]
MTTALKTCDYQGCEKYSVAKKGGLCNGHVQQKWKGQELTPLKVRARKYGPICSFKDCGQVHSAHGYCGGHGMQIKEGRELTPLQEKAEYGAWANGLRTCPGCKTLKGESEYYRNTANPSGLSTYCRTCDGWRRIKSTYNLTKAEWLAIWAYQDEKCAGCGATESGGERAMHTDHDHDHCPIGKSCGLCVMGILCVGCNTNGDRLQTPEFIAYRARVAALGTPLIHHVAPRYSLTA